MMRSEIVALTFAAFCVLLIVLIVFASKNKKLKLLAKLNTKNQEIILRNFGFIYWVYMLLINFANVALIFYLHDVFGNIVFFALPILLILFHPIHSWFYSNLLERAKIKEQAAD